MIKILYVDQLEGAFESIRMMLETKSIVCEYAKDCETAMEMINDEYMMIFTELFFGQNKMNGLELIKSVKQKYPDIPIALIYAYATLDTQKNASLLGAFASLRKPFLMKEIFKLYDEACEIRNPNCNSGCR